jgi:hypothetical protein
MFSWAASLFRRGRSSRHSNRQQISLAFIPRLEFLETRLTPAVLSPVQAIKARIAAEYPAINDPSTTNFQKTNILRQWAYEEIVVSDGARLIDQSMFTNGAASVPGLVSLFDRAAGGVMCGGAAWFLEDLYQMYGFNAGIIGCGFTHMAHVVTIVAFSDGGIHKDIIQDAYFNQTYVDTNGNALDTATLHSLLLNHQESQVVVQPGDIVGRTVICSTQTMQYLQQTPDFEDSPTTGALTFQYVRPGTWSFITMMSGQTANQYWVPGQNGGVLVGQSYPADLLSLLLYPDWASNALAKRYIAIAGGTYNYACPPETWANGGLTIPTTQDAQTPFTIGYTYTITNWAPVKSFTISFFASTDGIYGNPNDLFLASQTIQGGGLTSVGIHTGTSPSLTLGRTGDQYIIAVITGGGLPVAVVSSQTVTVTGQTDLVVQTGQRGYSAQPLTAPTTSTGATTVVLPSGQRVTLAKGRDGFSGATVVTPAAPSAVKANWRFGGLAASEYRVQVNWTNTPRASINAVFYVYDGTTLLATVDLNERQAPVGVQAGGVTYQSLGVFEVDSGQLKVVGINAVGGTGITRAVRIVAAPPPATDLNWSNDGLDSRATAEVGSPFTITRSYTVSGEDVKHDFTIGYFISPDSTFGDGNETLVDTETISAASAGTVGTYQGSSPPLEIDNPGTWYLFAVLDTGTASRETDEMNNVIGAAQPIIVTATDLFDNNFSAGEPVVLVQQTGLWRTVGAQLKALPAGGANTDAVSTAAISGSLPATVTISASIGTNLAPGYATSAFVIFNYQSPTSFMYAGLRPWTSGWVIGYRNATGWHDVVTTANALPLSPNYQLKVVLDGDTVSLSAAGVPFLGTTFVTPSGTLTTGKLGLGSNASSAYFNDFTVF